MQKHHNTVAALALIAFLGLSTSAGAATGVIRFEGAIIDDACPVGRIGNKIYLECSNEKPVIYQFTHAGVLRTDHLPPTFSGLQTRWLDAEHRVGVITVIYN